MVFPTQGSNPGLPHCKQTLYCLSPQGGPCDVIRCDDVTKKANTCYSPCSFPLREGDLTLGLLSSAPGGQPPSTRALLGAAPPPHSGTCPARTKAHLLLRPQVSRPSPSDHRLPGQPHCPESGAQRCRRLWAVRVRSGPENYPGTALGAWLLPAEGAPTRSRSSSRRPEPPGVWAQGAADPRAAQPGSALGPW